MNNKGKLYTLAFGILLSVGMIGFGMFLGYHFADTSKVIDHFPDGRKMVDTIVIEKTDTIRLQRFDTIVENVVRYRNVYVHDTAFVFADDTIKIPITQKWYHEDSLCDVWVSGYEPNLDSLHLYQKHTTEIVNHFREVTKMPRLTADVGIQGLYLQDRLVGSVGAEVRYNAPKMSYSAFGCYTTDKKAVVGASVGYRFDIK